MPPGAHWPSETTDDGEDAGAGADASQDPDAAGDPSIDPEDPLAPSDPSNPLNPANPSDPSRPRPTEFGPVCLDFLEMFNGASDRTACLACINKAQLGTCRAAQMDATEMGPPCGAANDCASLKCQCAKTCPSSLCTCIERCMEDAPSLCLDRWTNLWSCIHHACDEACS